MKTLDLFSGIGGFALAARMINDERSSNTFSTDQLVEIDPYCQKVLNKNFSGVPIHEDVRTYTASPGHFDTITAGFPCTDLSSAGPKTGLKGERSGLFFEVVRLIREARPKYVLLENVSALLSGNKGRDMGTVLRELSECGYDARWSIVSACSMGFPHVRKRVFIVAYSHSINRTERMAFQCWDCQKSIQAVYDGALLGNGKATTPRASGGSYGLSGRLDPDMKQRLKALGNSVVPQVAAVPLRMIADCHLEDGSNG